MISAYQEFADRFDPDELQQNFDKTLNGKPLLKKMNQLKCASAYMYFKYFQARRQGLTAAFSGDFDKGPVPVP